MFLDLFIRVHCTMKTCCNFQNSKLPPSDHLLKLKLKMRMQITLLFLNSRSKVKYGSRAVGVQNLLLLENLKIYIILLCEIINSTHLLTLLSFHTCMTVLLNTKKKIYFFLNVFVHIIKVNGIQIFVAIFGFALTSVLICLRVNHTA